MKKILYVLVIALVATACSGPKYTASFNSYDRHVSNQVVQPARPETIMAEPAPVIQTEQLMASTSSAPVEIKSAPAEEVRKTYIQMTKVERKELRTHLRSEIKSYVKEQKKNLGIESTTATTAMDNDLKMAVIFGAIGLVLGAFFGVNEIIGFIGFVAIVIALVFLIKWLVRQ